MDPEDEAVARPGRPAPPPPPYVALQERVGRLRDRLAGAPELLRQPRATPFVPDSETVEIDVRRHGLVLLWPTVRTLAGLAVLLVGPDLPLVLLFAGATLAAMGLRERPSLRSFGLAGAGAVVAVVALPLWVHVPALLLWLAHDVADWAWDRLVVSNRRIYRRYGVVTSHAPSIALTSIAFLDASVPPLGRVLDYGTLRLDSVAQRDAPLSRFDHVPRVTAVSHQILELRAKAMPKFPPPAL